MVKRGSAISAFLDISHPQGAERPAWPALAASAAVHGLVILAVVLGAHLLSNRQLGERANFGDAIEIDLGPASAPVAQAPAPQPIIEPVPQPERAPRFVAPFSPAPSDLAAQQETPPPTPQPIQQTAPAPQTSTNAASSSAGSPAAAISPRERDAYAATLMAWLNRFKRYPPEARRARVEGEALVRFAIDADGQVSNVRITRSTGHPELDQAALDTFARAAPLPAPPASFMRGPTTTLSLAIDFSLTTR